MSAERHRVLCAQGQHPESSAALDLGPGTRPALCKTGSYRLTSEGLARILCVMMAQHTKARKSRSLSPGWPPRVSDVRAAAQVG